MASAVNQGQWREAENRPSFKYLGAIITDEGSMPEIRSRIVQTIAALTKLKIIWDDKNINLSSKVRLLRSLVMSIFLYSSETWTLTAEIERKMQTAEMRSFRRLLGISYTDHITNEEVRSRIRKAIGPYEEPLSTVNRRKMNWYGHVTRASGLVKTVLHGTVRRGRRRGRQRKRWENNVRDCYLQEISEDTSLWFGLSSIDTVTPHGLLMLWNRFLDFAVEHWFGCRATEPGFAGDIGAIEVWLIDWLIDWLDEFGT